MPGFTRLLRAAVIALLLTLVGPAASASIAQPPAAPGNYAYNSHHQSATRTDPATDRGPPASYDHVYAYDAVDRWSHSASGRPDGPPPGSTTTYTTPAKFVRVARATASTQPTVQGDARALSSLVRSDVAANAGDDVVRALSATERRTLDDALRPDKLDHIFDPKHNFQPLVQQFGSREAAMEQIVRSIGGPLPQAGRFEIAQSIGGQTVIIRGAVVNGIPRIGTAFTP